LLNLLFYGTRGRYGEQGSLLKGLVVHQNHTVYKGYLLTARVERDNDSDTAPASGPRFSAMVTVAPADMIQRFAEPYLVPCFAQGKFAESPRDAVHSAIAHGRDIVDALQGVKPL